MHLLSQDGDKFRCWVIDHEELISREAFYECVEDSLVSGVLINKGYLEYRYSFYTPEVPLFLFKSKIVVDCFGSLACIRGAVDEVIPISRICRRFSTLNVDSYSFKHSITFKLDDNFDYSEGIIFRGMHNVKFDVTDLHDNGVLLKLGKEGGIIIDKNKKCFEK